MEDFKYEPLNSSSEQIRVLHLFPRSQPSKSSSASSQLQSAPGSQATGDAGAASLAQDLLAQTKKLTLADPAQATLAAEIAKKVEQLKATIATQPAAPEIQGRLEVVSLNDPPKYTALSYVWGSSLDQCTILLNNAAVTITHNLAQALQHIQHETEPLVLWIDAICINQKDNREKSEQVLRMKQIYENAITVLVWLGPAAEDSNAVMQVAETIGQQLVKAGFPGKKMPSGADGSQVIRHVIETVPNFVPLFRGPHLASLVKAYRSMMTREWWYRVWVVQEYCAAQNVQMVCGSKRVEAAAFEAAATFLSIVFSSTSDQFSHTQDWYEMMEDGTRDIYSVAPRQSAAKKMLSQRHHYQRGYEGGRPQKLLNLLIDFHTIYEQDSRLRCTDPRDRIYGLLGLASDREALDIIPDYDKAVEEVYTEAAARSLVQPDIRLLPYSQQGLQNTSMPSWAPDWRLNLYQTPNFSTDLDKPFTAHGVHSHERISLHALNPRILTISGSAVDSVSELADTLEQFPYRSKNVLKMFPRMAQHLASVARLCDTSAGKQPCVYGADPASWLEAAKRRIPVVDQEIIDGADLDVRRRYTPESDGRHQSLLDMITVYDKLLADISAEHFGPETAPAFAEEMRRRWGAFNLYLKAMMRSFGRRPFLTEKGYVGLAPAAAQVGDRVVVFCGAQTPFVLRPAGEEGTYKLVGDCYVHGVMDGELMQDSAEIADFDIS